MRAHHIINQLNAELDIELALIEAEESAQVGQLKAEAFRSEQCGLDDLNDYPSLIAFAHAWADQCRTAVLMAAI